DLAGLEAKSVILEESLPQPGTMTTVTITEQQLTSWIAMEMKNNPTCLERVRSTCAMGRCGSQGMVNGSESVTSALVVGELSIDVNKASLLQDRVNADQPTG
ncbi:MAG: hypothetical protein IPG80_04760, partial [Anaerolineales bacterium]|uniref:hypothetical protein n=1 Tax=Candidatus Villigracilis vicinus TaxID=3140679 RepID=UPI0031370242|nr:hypothetical protein [Anaerolineales bacterium]